MNGLEETCTLKKLMPTIPVIIYSAHMDSFFEKEALAAGASAVVVSNHGGRQLDTVQASLRALPEIVSAVNGQIEVLMDGGIRRGADIVKAICLGARAVLCGRAYAYALAAAGQAGVARALEILREDLARTLRLLGCPAVRALDRSYVDCSALRNKSRHL